jgi:hypothetical protein
MMPGATHTVAWEPVPARRTAICSDAVAVAVFLAVAAVLTYRVIANLNVPGAPALPRFGLQDFRDAVYYPVRAFLDGNDPYDAAAHLRRYPVGDVFAPYLPMTLVLHAPLGLLPFRVAEFVYYALLLVVILAVAQVTLRAAGIAPTVARVFGLGAAILTSRPGHWSVVIGQCTPIAVLGTCVALGSARDRPWRGGFGLALAAFKPTFGLPLAVLLAARGERLAVTIGVTIAVAVSAGATAVLAAGAGGVPALAASLGHAYAAFSAETSVDPAVSWSRVDAIGLLGRLLGQSPVPAVEIAVGLGVLGLGAIGVSRLARVDDPGGRRVSSCLACLTILTCTYHQGYDLLLLTLPTVALATAADTWPWRARPALRRALLILFAIPAINYLGSEHALHLFGLGQGVWLAATSVDGVAVLTAFAGFAVLALERHDRTSRRTIQ